MFFDPVFESAFILDAELFGSRIVVAQNLNSQFAGGAMFFSQNNPENRLFFLAYSLKSDGQHMEKYKAFCLTCQPDVRY